MVDNNAISLLNDGSFTYHNVYTNCKSAIDLSLCSSNIFLDFTWGVDDYLNGSDHFPIYIRINENQPSAVSPKWKLDEANWGKYSQDVNLEREFESFESHIEAYDYFLEKMLASAEMNIPKLKGFHVGLQFHGGMIHVPN